MFTSADVHFPNLSLEQPEFLQARLILGLEFRFRVGCTFTLLSPDHGIIVMAGIDEVGLLGGLWVSV